MKYEASACPRNIRTIFKNSLDLVLAFVALCVTAPSALALPATYDSTVTVNLAFPQPIANVFNYTVTDPSNSFANGILTVEMDGHFYAGAPRDPGTLSRTDKGLDTTFSLFNLSDRTQDLHFMATISFDATSDLTGYDLNFYGETSGLMRSSTRVFNIFDFGFPSVATFHKTWTVDILVNMARESQMDMWLVGKSSMWGAPEPTTLILLGSGLVGLAGCSRRKFKR